MIPTAGLLLLSLAAALWLLRRQQADEAAQDAGAGLFFNWSNLGEEFGPDAWRVLASNASADANIAAFLGMLRVSEGTADANGYRAMFGHRPGRPVVFDGWADHPRRAVQFKDGAGRLLWTSAAGAYQFMAVSPLPTGGKSTKVDTWDRLKRKLQLPDFSPASQDRAAVELIDEAGALADVQAGRFAVAVGKVRRIWASLPGAGYSQHENRLTDLQAAYVNAGGNLA